MLKRQFSFREKESKSLRCSGLGKAAVLQSLSWLGYEQEAITFRNKMIFIDGDYFEVLLIALLESAGVEIISPQSKVTFEGISGHCDFIIEDEGRKKVVEVKTANDNFFGAVKRSSSALEDRGYLTQAGVYCAGLGLEDFIFLIKNKNNGELMEIEGKPDKELVSRAARVIAKIKKMRCPEDILAEASGIRAPLPVKEFFRKQETGKFLVPPSMAYSPYRSAFYETAIGKNGYGKETNYCTGVKKEVTDQSLKASFRKEKG